MKEIDRRIGEGLLKAGERLIESELASELGVSRVPVREAIRILAGEGVVEISRGRSARIRSVNAEMVIDIIKVQGALLYLAIEEFLANDDYLEKLKDLQPIANRIMVLGQTADGLTIMRAISRFHWDIATYSRNGFLLEALQKLHPTIYFANLVERAGTPAIRTCAERYDDMMAALTARDAAQAIGLIRAMKDRLVAAANERAALEEAEATAIAARC